MTYANVGLLEATPGNRDALVEILTRPSAELADAGCLLYEVGVNDDDPEAVFVAELWVSAGAHAASLQLPGVQASIAEARPILSGRMEGMRFDVLGSPLRE
ncbi:putative quinol monooxygenase [Zhihengliuella halotolerans]|uniref:putative quinol monooxygenase n=1 Tax=Zhihengliuella halotolerans TaxID=370736 RepID=UPI000C7FBF3F|nr:putative quinol monooxygenase [Zhihengliuella halotolerans]